jgi:hypothetical protein
LTFWPPGPEARLAWTVMAAAGTRTEPFTTMGSLMATL